MVVCGRDVCGAVVPTRHVRTVSCGQSRAMVPGSGERGRIVRVLRCTVVGSERLDARLFLSVEKGEGMEEYSFEDALASSTVTCTFPHLEAVRLRGASKAQACPSLFFPGCSFINYGLPLVQAVYDLLKEAGRVEGISLVCCGKILEYEPSADEVRPAFEQQLRDRIVALSLIHI